MAVFFRQDMYLWFNTLPLRSSLLICINQLWLQAEILLHDSRSDGRRWKCTQSSWYVRFFQFLFKISTNHDSKPQKTRLKLYSVSGCALGSSKSAYRLSCGYLHIFLHMLPLDLLYYLQIHPACVILPEAPWTCCFLHLDCLLLGLTLFILWTH